MLVSRARGAPRPKPSVGYRALLIRLRISLTFHFASSPFLFSSSSLAFCSASFLFFSTMARFHGGRLSTSTSNMSSAPPEDEPVDEHVDAVIEDVDDVAIDEPVEPQGGGVDKDAVGGSAGCDPLQSGADGGI